MDSQTNEICFYSFNTRGHSSTKLQYINDLLSLPSKAKSFFSIQEHFLLRNNLYKLSNTFQDYAVIAKPAFKDFKSNNSVNGRPMGGLATIKA